MTHDLDHPVTRFHEELARAKALDPELEGEVAMSLATVSADGVPSVRIVLLKDADARGFVFYTNRESHKGKDLDATKRAALAFHFRATKVQVRVEGDVERTSDEESDAYFATRPALSQLNAWSSAQSRPLSTPDALGRAAARAARELGIAPDGSSASRPVPRPPHWGGYRLWFDALELWTEGANRFHERILYKRSLERADAHSFRASAWSAQRLQP